MFYSNSIFAGPNATLYTNITYSVQVVVTFFCGRIIGKYGRRNLLIYGMIICIITMGSLTYIFMKVLSTTWALIFMILYIAGFSISLGPLTWLYNADILPQVGVSISTMVNLTFATSIAFIVPNFDMKWVFLFFTVSSCFGLLFIIIYVVEVNNLTMEDIWRKMGIKDLKQEEVSLIDD